jgi:hypothetical protein
MKKSLVLALALALAPMAVQAQSTTATVNATAIIQANLVVGPVTDLDFGSLTPGTGIVVNPGAAVPAGATRGEFQITHNSDVLVSLAAVPTDLVGPGGTTIAVAFSCGYSPTAGGAATPGACNALGNTGIATPGTDEDTFVQIGGTILGANTSVQAGTYTASMTFTVAAQY